MSYASSATFRSIVTLVYGVPSTSCTTKTDEEVSGTNLGPNQNAHTNHIKSTENIIFTIIDC